MISDFQIIPAGADENRLGEGLLKVWNNGLKASCCRWIAIILACEVTTASGQVALQNSLAGAAAAGDRSQQMQSERSQGYTFKEGDFQMLMVPAMGLEWNDNINLAQTNELADEIVTPTVRITASYPFTQRNLLYLDVTVAYDWYLEHPQFSSFELNSSSGTGLSFDFVVKDITVNLHDWISYSEGAGQNGSATSTANPTALNTANSFVGNTANGSVNNTASYGTFQNTAGLSVAWDLNKVTLSTGYDHQNILATSGQFDNINHAAEMLFVRAGLQMHPKATVGLESTAAFTTYEQPSLNDNDAYTIGPYIEFRPGRFFSLTIRGGYTIYDFQNTSTAIQTTDQNSWYAGVNIAHQPSDSVSYSLDIGREVQLGIQSDLLEDWYVRPNISLKIIKDLDIAASFFYEHGDQGVGSTGTLPGNHNGTFDWYGGTLSLQHALTSQLTLALSYRITLRSSDTPNDGYTQNLVALQLTYHPK